MNGAIRLNNTEEVVEVSQIKRALGLGGLSYLSIIM